MKSRGNILISFRRINWPSWQIWCSLNVCLFFSGWLGGWALLDLFVYANGHYAVWSTLT